MGLPKRLKRLRSYTALSLQDLAAVVGCGHVTISRIENNKQRTSIDIAEGLAVALGVSPTYLAFGHEGGLPFKQKRPVPECPPQEPMPEPTTVGSANRHTTMPERLAEVRKARGLTLRGLATKAKLSAQAVLYIENRISVPKLDTCEQLAAALEVAPGWLAYGHEDGG